MVEWSYPIKGDLVLDSNGAQFENWVIPKTQVVDAVLNIERLLIKKQQSLLVDCGEEKYMFGLYKPIDHSRVLFQLCAQKGPEQRFSDAGAPGYEIPSFLPIHQSGIALTWPEHHSHEGIQL